MRRVVVTGLGIVSCIGNDAQTVTTSLRESKSGISFSEEQAENGFRSHAAGRPEIDTAALIDKRNLRFMGDGAAWNFIAMERAIADSGLAEDEVSHVRSGLIMGSGGPSTMNQLAATDIVREKGAPKPLYVLNELSDAGDAVQDQGRQLFDDLGLFDLGALHRPWGGAHSVRQAGYRLRGWRRRAALVADLPF